MHAFPLTLVAELMPEPMFIVSTSGHIIYANTAAATLTGTPAGALKGRLLSDWVENPESQLLHYLHLCIRTRAVLPSPIRWRQDHPALGKPRLQGICLRNSGEAPSVLIRAMPACAALREFRALNARLEAQSRALRALKQKEEELRQYRDYLEILVQIRTQGMEIANQQLRQQEHSLRASEAQLHRAQSVAHIGSWYLNLSQNCLHWSAEACRIYGLPAAGHPTFAEILGQVHPEDRQSVEACWHEAMRGQPFDITYRIQIDEEIRWVREQAQLDFNDDGSLKEGIGTLQNVTRQIEAESALQLANQELSRLATTDPLTGLTNRRALLERGAQCHLSSERYGTPYAVVIFDIDHFKEINDRYGHHVGDEVLTALTQRLRPCLRETDTLARWGGEEFIVLAPHSTMDEACLLAERLRQTLESSPMGAAGQVTASFGVACNRMGDDLEALLRQADDALYAAKRSGRNRVARTITAQSHEAMHSD